MKQTQQLIQTAQDRAIPNIDPILFPVKLKNGAVATAPFFLQSELNDDRQLCEHKRI
jgi:hypothetical protein